ncbi:MAG: hypothetical protein JNM78_07155 [Cyclobacteriaceae bacterium]|nr:hypothetical protein [Cyclobacteriaceae bacterium]
MSDLKEDIVIKSLRFAKSKYIEGEPFNFDSLKAQMKKDGYNQPNSDDRFAMVLFKEITSDIIINQSGERHMSLEAYIKLLEYDDLKETRIAAKDAQKWAVRAMWLSVIAIIVQIVTSN